MIRWVGAGLIGMCTTWLGIYVAANQYRRVRVLEELEQGLLALRRELELASVSLPQLMMRAEECCVGSGKVLFEQVRIGMKQLEEKTVDQIWQEALDGIENLPTEGRRCLLPLGSVLGSYAVQEQIQAVEVVRQNLGKIKDQYLETVRKQGKVYVTLGVTGGGFIILLCL